MAVLGLALTCLLPYQIDYAIVHHQHLNHSQLIVCCLVFHDKLFCALLPPPPPTTPQSHM